MVKPMKTIRESFEEYYAPVEVEKHGKKGIRIQYEYIGPKYYFGKRDSDMKAFKRISGLLTALAVAVYFTVGLVYSPVNYQGHAWIFAALALIPIVFQLAGMIELFATGDYLTELNFHGVRGKLMIAPSLSSLCLFVGVALGVEEIVKWNYPSYSITVVAGFLIAGIIEIILSVYIGRVPFYKR